MLYSNRKLKAEERVMTFGTIYQVAMGESGRGRKMMALTCPKDTIIERGLNKNLTIGKTKTGRPRINKLEDKELYLLLSSEGGYTRRGNGTIRVLKDKIDQFEIMARGNGADGDAGRVGYWDCMLLKVNGMVDNIIRVRSSGEGYGTPSDLYIIHKNEVYHCYLEDLEDCCDTLGIEIPCDIICTVDGFKFGDDWRIL